MVIMHVASYFPLKNITDNHSFEISTFFVTILDYAY